MDLSVVCLSIKKIENYQLIEFESLNEIVDHHFLSEIEN